MQPFGCHSQSCGWSGVAIQCVTPSSLWPPSTDRQTSPTIHANEIEAITLTDPPSAQATKTGTPFSGICSSTGIQRIARNGNTQNGSSSPRFAPYSWASAAVSWIENHRPHWHAHTTSGRWYASEPRIAADPSSTPSAIVMSFRSGLLNAAVLWTTSVVSSTPSPPAARFDARACESCIPCRSSDSAKGRSGQPTPGWRLATEHCSRPVG